MFATSGMMGFYVGCAISALVIALLYLCALLFEVKMSTSSKILSTLFIVSFFVLTNRIYNDFSYKADFANELEDLRNDYGRNIDECPISCYASRVPQYNTVISEALEKSDYSNTTIGDFRDSLYHEYNLDILKQFGWIVLSFLLLEVPAFLLAEREGSNNRTRIRERQRVRNRRRTY